MVQTLLFLVILHYRYKFRIYTGRFTLFAARYLAQLSVCGILFYGLYRIILLCITTYLPHTLTLFLTANIGLWLWAGPLSGAFLLLLYYWRTQWNITMHFLK